MQEPVLPTRALQGEDEKDFEIYLANVVCFWCQYIFISLHLGNRLDFNFQGIIWILISRESFGLLVGTTNSSIAELKTSQYQY